METTALYRIQKGKSFTGMLKYGRGSIHAIQQPLDDVCRDLHCQRDRYTWTSHPALEGTFCGNNKVSETSYNL
jgi:hypothetical protein